MGQHVASTSRKIKERLSNITPTQMPPSSDRTPANVSSTIGQEAGYSNPNAEDVEKCCNATTTSTCKKDHSDIWAHFEKILDPNGKEIGRVLCVWCRKNYQGKSGRGTSGLWKHLRESCKKIPNQKQLQATYKKKDKAQTTLHFQTLGNGPQGNLTYFKFDQSVCRESWLK
ncbi:hypothetical protein M5689_011184 [Euphorbia peplus]|nr:hypothetical protein M5689_011184 [Euphorbia peplus]